MNGPVGAVAATTGRRAAPRRPILRCVRSAGSRRTASSPMPIWSLSSAATSRSSRRRSWKRISRRFPCARSLASISGGSWRVLITNAQRRRCLDDELVDAGVDGRVGDRVVVVEHQDRRRCRRGRSWANRARATSRPAGHARPGRAGRAPRPATARTPRGRCRRCRASTSRSRPRADRASRSTPSTCRPPPALTPARAVRRRHRRAGRRSGGGPRGGGPHQRRHEGAGPRRERP